YEVAEAAHLQGGDGVAGFFGGAAAFDHGLVGGAGADHARGDRQAQEAQGLGGAGDGRGFGGSASDRRLAQDHESGFAQAADDVAGAHGGGEIEEGGADDQQGEVGQHHRAGDFFLQHRRGVDDQGVGARAGHVDLQGEELGARGGDHGRSVV